MYLFTDEYFFSGSNAKVFLPRYVFLFRINAKVFLPRYLFPLRRNAKVFSSKIYISSWKKSRKYFF